MATTSTIQAQEKLPPYLPFATFKSAVQNLRAHGLPDILDKTTWHSQSGGMQKQIIGAFAFLRLIDDSGRPTPILRNLQGAAENSEDEKTNIKSILYAAYPNLFDMNLKTATPGQVAEAIASLNVTGATRDRAMRFFLKAAQYAGVELSSRLTAGLRSSESQSGTAGAEENGDAAPAATPQTRIRRRRRSSSAATETETDTTEDQQPTGKAVKTIKLRNVDGELTLSGTFNPFELDAEERKLVYDITDLMKQYEKNQEPEI